ncbi:hypothetical protein D3C85_1613280 [compost metagenome]
MFRGWIRLPFVINYPECLAKLNATQSQMKARTQYITRQQMDFVYYQMLNGNTLAKRERLDIGMQVLIKLHGIEKTPTDLFIK